LLILAGCVHHSPEEAMLAPLVAQLTQEPFDQSNQPEYLIFTDELTAKVFKSLRRDNRYRILPRGKAFVCPPDVNPCPQVHTLHAGVARLWGDSAIATIERLVFDRWGRAMLASEQILLVRRSGRWKIERVLGYATGLLG
jgi:hypothetical protein